MNILTLCLSKDLGGLELYALRTATQLSTNHQVTVACTADSKLAEKLRSTTIDIAITSTRFHHLPLISAYRLARIIDTKKIDLIHMHWGKDLPLAALAKTLSKRKPRLVYTRQMMITRYKNDLYHRFQYSRLDLLITITKQLETLCRKYIDSDNTRIKTLYYGVDEPEELLEPENRIRLRQEKGFTADDFIVGLFGRLEDGKGQHLLIKAIAMAKREGRDIRALIVGHEMTPGYREILTTLADENGVTDHIVFNGFVDNPQRLMQICDCLCLTTYEETFGLVLPEAMRAGITVIGSNRGGVPEIIDHAETGLLFESKEASSLYRQLALLYDEPETRRRLAEKGKQKADRQFDTQHHFNALEELLIEEVKR